MIVNYVVREWHRCVAVVSLPHCACKALEATLYKLWWGWNWTHYGLTQYRLCQWTWFSVNAVGTCTCVFINTKIYCKYKQQLAPGYHNYTAFSVCAYINRPFVIYIACTNREGLSFVFLVFNSVYANPMGLPMIQ